MDNSAHVDSTTITMLQEVMDDGFDHLVRTYIEDSDRRLQSLKDAIAGQDAEAIRQTAHSLKGSSGNLGASAMAELSLNMEQKGKSGDMDGLDDLWQQMNTEYRAVREYMEGLLS